MHPIVLALEQERDRLSASLQGLTGYRRAVVVHEIRKLTETILALRDPTAW